MPTLVNYQSGLSGKYLADDQPWSYTLGHGYDRNSRGPGVYGDIPPIRLPQRIILALDFAGLTALKVARRLEVSPRSVQGWAGGRSNPNLPTLRELARVCAVDSVWLIGDYKGPQRRQKPAANVKLRGRDSNPQPSGLTLFTIAA